MLHAGRREECLSYRAVLRHAQRYAALYRDRGLSPGEAVAILLPHSVDLYAAFLGALLGGFVPSIWAHPSPKTTSEEFAAQFSVQLENARPRLLVLHPEFRAAVAAGGASVPCCAPDDAPREPSPLPPFEPPDADAIAFVQYSSGTTGFKKGVAISHRALLWQVDAYARAIELREDDRIVTWLPLYHDMGLICCLLLPLLHRVPLVAMSPFEWVARPAMWLRAVSDHGGTLAWLPNFAFSFLAHAVRDEELAGVDLSLLRGVVNCSEPILAASHEQFLARFGPLGLRPTALCSSYAMAENTFAVTSGGFERPLREECIDGARFAREGRAVPVCPTHPAARPMVSSGRPLPQTHIAIVDRDGRELPERHVGEIVVRSPCLLSEYYRNPAATRRFLRDGRLFTGDLGYLADGELYVTGRRKDLIIVRGQNIYPQDVEAAVQGVDGVIPGRLAAIGVPDERLGTEALVLLVETHERGQTARRRLVEQIRRRVFAVAQVDPRDVCLLPHMWLRKSTSGKISREINRRRYLEQLADRQPQPVAAEATSPPAAAGPVVSPRKQGVRAGPVAGGGANDLVARVRTCVRRALAVANRAQEVEPSPDAALLSSGLFDSLGLVHLLNALEAEFDLTLPPAVLSDPLRLDTITRIADTIRTLSRDGNAVAAESPAPPAAESEPPTPSWSAPARRRSGGLWTWYYRWVFRRLGVRVGRGLIVRGPLILRLEGDARNVQIGSDVTLMPGVDLKLRENGRIVLGDGVFLDTNVRLVAARQACIRLGAGVRLGIGTVVNAGADVTIGAGTAVAGYCMILASEHRYESRAPVMSQGYRHAPICIGRDVWLAAGAIIGRGSRIGDGAVIGAQCFVQGRVPPWAVLAGHPPRIIRYRT